jgi:hypothetical protein
MTLAENISDGMNERLRYLAAKFGLGILDPDSIQGAIDNLMDEGIYHDDFLEVMDLKAPRMDQVIQPFLRTLKRLGIEAPEKEEAVWLLIDHHTSRIAMQKVEAIEGLKQLKTDIYKGYNLQTLTKKYVGDSHGIEHLIGLYWGYQEMLERPNEVTYGGMTGSEGIEKIECEIVLEAKRWKKKYSPSLGSKGRGPYGPSRN